MSRPRPDLSSHKSRRTKRILIITLGSALALGGVAFSTSASLGAKLGWENGSKPEIVHQPQARNSARNGDLLRFAGIAKPARTSSATSPAPAAMAPTVTATKTDSLFADGDSDNQADPGDTIKYTVNITSTGDTAT